MPLCGGDVPSGKGGTNAGGARLERQSWCACMKLPAAHRGGIPNSLLFALVSRKTLTDFTVLQDVQLLEHLRKGSHFFLMSVLFPKSFSSVGLE